MLLGNSEPLGAALNPSRREPAFNHPLWKGWFLRRERRPTGGTPPGPAKPSQAKPSPAQPGREAPCCSLWALLVWRNSSVSAQLPESSQSLRSKVTIFLHAAPFPVPSLGSFRRDVERLPSPATPGQARPGLPLPRLRGQGDQGRVEWAECFSHSHERCRPSGGSPATPAPQAPRSGTEGAAAWPTDSPTPLQKRQQRSSSLPQAPPWLPTGTSHCWAILPTGWLLGRGLSRATSSRPPPSTLHDKEGPVLGGQNHLLPAGRLQLVEFLQFLLQQSLASAQGKPQGVHLPRLLWEEAPQGQFRSKSRWRWGPFLGGIKQAGGSGPVVNRVPNWQPTSLTEGDIPLFLSRPLGSCWPANLPTPLPTRRAVVSPLGLLPSPIRAHQLWQGQQHLGISTAPSHLPLPPHNATGARNGQAATPLLRELASETLHQL